MSVSLHEHRLRRHVSGPPGSDRLAAVRRATEESFGDEWAELAACDLAEGNSRAQRPLAE
jgi:hypothetical protein